MTDDIGLQMAYDTNRLTCNISHFSNFPELYLAEPKFDGLRSVCIIREKDNIEFLTRFGNKVHNVDIIQHEIAEQPKLIGFVLDGEIYSKNWSETISITKTIKTHKIAENLIFYVFDILTITEWENKQCNKPLIERKKLLNSKLIDTPHVQKVRFKKIKDLQDAYKIYEYYLSKGLEGIMLKRIDSLYKFKRTKDWLKVKDVLTDEFLVVDILEGTGKYKGMLGSVVIQLKDGRKMKVGTGFTDEQRKKYWNNKNLILNKYIEVAYQELTNDGKLRNPRFIRVREDIK